MLGGHRTIHKTPLAPATGRCGNLYMRRHGLPHADWQRRRMARYNGAAFLTHRHHTLRGQNATPFPPPLPPCALCRQLRHNKTAGTGRDSSASSGDSHSRAPCCQYGRLLHAAPAALLPWRIRLTLFGEHFPSLAPPSLAYGLFRSPTQQLLLRLAVSLHTLLYACWTLWLPRRSPLPPPHTLQHHSIIPPAYPATAATPLRSPTATEPDRQARMT